MTKEIVNIEISRINDFPKQRAIYGEPVIEPEFTASVKECGIITPVIVFAVIGDSLSQQEYTLISGHRRVAAAIEAGLTEVPAIIRRYELPEDAELEFLTCNMQREKSHRTRVKEFLHYKQILCQLGKVRKKSRSYENTIFENTMFSRILEDNINTDNLSDISLDSVAILKEVTGYTKYEQEMLVVLYDEDWLQKKLDELRKLGINLSTEDNLLTQHRLAVQEYEAGSCTLHNAVSEIKRIFNELKSKLQKKTEKKEPKPKREIKKQPLKLLMPIFEFDEPVISYYKVPNRNQEILATEKGLYLKIESQVSFQINIEALLHEIY